MHPLIEFQYTTVNEFVKQVLEGNVLSSIEDALILSYITYIQKLTNGLMLVMQMILTYMKMRSYNNLPNLSLIKFFICV